MTGLSPRTVARLEQLEKQPELLSWDRGELRSMLHSAPTPRERARVERLLTATETASRPDDSPSGREAYQRGLERGSAAGGSAYTRGT